MPFAEKLFWDNVNYNSLLSKGKAKAKIRRIGRKLTMTPDEVIEKLRTMNVNISRRTLLNYEKWGLIPEARRGGAGRGKGRTTDYPDETVAEAFAAWQLMRGEPKYSPEAVARARKYALAVEEDLKSVEDITTSLLSNDPVEGLWAKWLNLRNKIPPRKTQAKTIKKLKAIRAAFDVVLDFNDFNSLSDERLNELLGTIKTKDDVVNFLDALKHSLRLFLQEEK